MWANPEAVLPKSAGNNPNYRETHLLLPPAELSARKRKASVRLLAWLLRGKSRYWEIAMKRTLILFTLLLYVGCGGRASTSAPTAASWEGTWSGNVDWVSPSSSSSKPSAGDTVTITLGVPFSTPCQGCRSPLTIILFKGTNVGPELGNVALQGEIDLYADKLTSSVVSPSIAGNPYSNAIERDEVWTLKGNTITITGIGTNAHGQAVPLLMGTLTKQ